MTRHRLSRRTATTTRFSPKGIGCQKQTAPSCCQHPMRLLLPRKHSPDGATSTHPFKQACYSFIDPGRMKGWVSLVGWPVAVGLPTFTRRLQAERRTRSVRRSKTGVPPTVLRNQPCTVLRYLWRCSECFVWWKDSGSLQHWSRGVPAA